MNKGIKNILVFLFLSFVSQIFAQQNNKEITEVSINDKTRELSLNMSGLISQLIPFSSNGNLTGPFDITWLSGRNNTFFRMSLGGNIGANDQLGINGDFGHLALGIGFTKRKIVYKNWIYESSILGMAYGGGLNAPNANDQNGAGLGVGLGFAPGYQISDRVRINAEAILFVGLGTSLVQIVFIPPVAVNLKYRFNAY